MKKSYKKILTISGAALAVILFMSLFGARLAFASEITPENLSLLINKQRTYYGLSPLTLNNDLDRASYLKSRDMLRRNYFEHYAFGLTPWVFIRNSGYDYLEAGENLAMDFDTSEGVVSAWMNSPAHRANILNPDFEDMGLGVVKGVFDDLEGEHQTIMITNMFGKVKSPLVSQARLTVNRILSFIGL